MLTFSGFQSTLPRREWLRVQTSCILVTIFQSTLPRREWLSLKYSCFVPRYFNPHSHEGSDRNTHLWKLRWLEFQSTLPRREWHANIGVKSILKYFNPHSHEGSDRKVGLIISVLANFNPHSHEGSDCRFFLPIDLPKISIHTPTKGVTDLIDQFFKLPLFQSTLPRREWLVRIDGFLKWDDFNPHSHEGSDYTGTSPMFAYCGFQSTLPRREWHDCSSLLIQAWDFNPHSHEGSDWIVAKASVFDSISIHTPTKGVTSCPGEPKRVWRFQSTLPRREWREVAMITDEFREFQSTLPRREWLLRFFPYLLPFHISIHTPTKGVTKPDKWRDKQEYISIHTPTKGVTVDWIYQRICIQFQSTLPRREWRMGIMSHLEYRIFQSTLPRREWQIGNLAQLTTSVFQSTLPRREWPA